MSNFIENLKKFETHFYLKYSRSKSFLNTFVFCKLKEQFLRVTYIQVQFFLNLRLKSKVLFKTEQAQVVFKLKFFSSIRLSVNSVTL